VAPLLCTRGGPPPEEGVDEDTCCSSIPTDAEFRRSSTTPALPPPAAVLFNGFCGINLAILAFSLSCRPWLVDCKLENRGKNAYLIVFTTLILYNYELVRRLRRTQDEGDMMSLPLTPEVPSSLEEGMMMEAEELRNLTGMSSSATESPSRSHPLFPRVSHHNTADIRTNPFWLPSS
jgi:hypothetical protein